MPPAQCPECGRFLSKEFVGALTDEPTPCPSCETPLMAADFGRSGTSGRPAARDAVAAAEEVAADPGLAATDAVDAPSDPLEGWDRGSLVDLDDWRSGQADGPSDAAIIGIAAAVGALLGLLLGRPGRLAAMVFGAILGAGAGAASRRVWELDT